MAFIFAKLDVTLRDHDRLLKAIKSVGWGALGVYSWAMMYLREKQSETGVLSDEVIDMSMPIRRTRVGSLRPSWWPDSSSEDRLRVAFTFITTRKRTIQRL